MSDYRGPGGANTSRRSSQPATGIAAATTDRMRRRVSEVSTLSMNLQSDVVPSPGPGSVYSHTVDKPADKISRKMKGGKEAIDSSSFDPEYYNPDGSVRQVHRMPDFAASYSEASKARYIRHRMLPDKEKELTVKQIFDKP